MVKKTMAKATKKSAKDTGAAMSTEVFEDLHLLEQKKGIPMDFMLDKIKKAIVTACKNNYGNEDVLVEIDEATGKFEAYLRKEVVEEVFDPGFEILVDEANKFPGDHELGSFVNIRLDTK